MLTIIINLFVIALFINAILQLRYNMTSAKADTYRNAILLLEIEIAKKKDEHADHQELEDLYQKHAMYLNKLESAYNEEHEENTNKIRNLFYGISIPLLIWYGIQLLMLL